MPELHCGSQPAVAGVNEKLTRVGTLPPKILFSLVLSLPVPSGRGTTSGNRDRATPQRWLARAVDSYSCSLMTGISASMMRAVSAVRGNRQLPIREDRLMQLWEDHAPYGSYRTLPGKAGFGT